MNTKVDQVKHLFDQPELYLAKNYDIAIRSLIVRELLGNVSDATIMDLGCGDGSISLQFAPDAASILLVDLSEAMLNIARQNTPDEVRHKVRYAQLDLHQDRAEERFDVVLCIGVLAHVTSVEDVVRNVARRLKPGGRCIFQLTDVDAPLGRLMTAYGGMRNAILRQRKHSLNEMGFSELVSLAGSSGLTLVATRRYLSPILGMGRLPNKWLFKYELFTLRHTAISRFGSEVLGLFRKPV